MPPARYRRLALRTTVVLTIGLLATGTAAVVAHPTSAPSNDDKSVAKPLYELDPGSHGNNTTLLTRDEMYHSVLDRDRSDTNASLYVVAENGTWFHASPDGTIGAKAPDGAVIPNFEDETANLPPSDRPVYVWKVTVNNCGTTLYNATDGTSIAAYPIPGCDAPSPSTEVSPASPTQAQTDAPTRGSTPGFGIGIALMAIVVAIGIRTLHRIDAK